jgi:hypothetical protein
MVDIERVRFTLRLPPDLDRRIGGYADRRGNSKAEAIIAAIKQYLPGGPPAGHVVRVVESSKAMYPNHGGPPSRDYSKVSSGKGDGAKTPPGVSVAKRLREMG